MKASDYVALFLQAQGVTHVFEVAGGMITHLVDSLHRQGGIQLVSVHHEQTAAFAAEAYARMTGVPGIALATSGPGATNLLTGIGSCYFDSTPAVFITGQVNRAEQKGGRPIRQLGFQETDVVSMAAPITKAAWRVESAEQIPAALENAFALAQAERPGPVLLDVPMDVQWAAISDECPSRVSLSSERSPDSGHVDELLAELSRAQRPLILVGGGIRSASAATLFKSLAELLQIPVVYSLMAVDVLPFAHPLRIGMIGTYGNRWANLALGRCDMLLVLGSRLDVRQTGSDTEAFRANRTIYQVDCDAAEINNRVRGCCAIAADLRSFLTQVLGSYGARVFQDRTPWRTEIAELRNAWPDTAEVADAPGTNPNELMHQLSAVSRKAAAYVVDVGNHQMWAAQSLELHGNQRFLTSGGMGAMGFGLPAAVGAALASRGEPVVVIAGDGGFQLNIQELQTLVHHRLPIKIVVLNNQSYGMVRQFQQSYFEARYPSTCWGYSAPDFVRVAEAYGIQARSVGSLAELPGALDELWRDPHAPFLLQVMVDTSTNAYPKNAYGRSITEMEPFAKPIKMEGT